MMPAETSEFGALLLSAHRTLLRAHNLTTETMHKNNVLEALESVRDSLDALGLLGDEGDDYDDDDDDE